MPTTYTPGSTLTFDVGLTGVTDLNSYDVGLALTSSKGTAGTDFYFVGSPGTVAPSTDYVFNPESVRNALRLRGDGGRDIGHEYVAAFSLRFPGERRVVSDASPNTMLATVVIRTTPEAGTLTLSFDGTPLELLTPGGQAAPGSSTLTANLASFNPPPVAIVPEPTTLALLRGPLLAGVILAYCSWRRKRRRSLPLADGPPILALPSRGTTSARRAA